LSKRSRPRPPLSSSKLDIDHALGHHHRRPSRTPTAPSATIVVVQVGRRRDHPRPSTPPSSPAIVVHDLLDRDNRHLNPPVSPSHPRPSTPPSSPAVVVHDLATYSTAAISPPSESLPCADDEGETKHLCNLHGAATRLHLFQIDILDYSSLLTAIRGTAGVFHLAYPCIVDRVCDPKGELLDPEVKGTVNVLRAAKECGVMMVVVTSSISAIIPSPS
ncbi:hypothetical protein Taro_000283, partial [Colocasia esculenta]|nr:hypothetical protein [Colocasia esculenta]